jgi:molecular chaperone GrpE
MQEEFKKDNENNTEVNSPEGNSEEEKHAGNAVNPDADVAKKHKKPVKKEDHTKELEAKIDELNDKYLRLYSEFDNYRKRTFKEKGELIKTASEEIMIALLPVLDDLERAVKSINGLNEEEKHPVNDGIILIYNKLKSLLETRGLEQIKASGTEFNVDYHDAVTNIPAPSEELKGKVIEEIEKGYMLNGKVIRFAKVVVGS